MSLVDTVVDVSCRILFFVIFSTSTVCLHTVQETWASWVEFEAFAQVVFGNRREVCLRKATSS